MDCPANHGSSTGKNRLWSTAFKNAKSMGFSVWLMDGISETIKAHKMKKPRKIPSAASNQGHSLRTKASIDSRLRQIIRNAIKPPNTKIPKIVALVFGAMWLSPRTHKR